MLGRCRRAAVVLALAFGTSGCVTGHLLDLGRRREQVLAVHEAFTSDDRLLLRYTALVTDDVDTPLARTSRWVAIPLSALGTGTPFPVEGAPVTPLDSSDVTRASSLPEPVRVVETDDGSGETRSRRPAALVIRDTTIPAATLTTTRTAFWVYPLVPVTLAIDAATTPVLLFFAPAVLAVGE